VDYLVLKWTVGSEVSNTLSHVNVGTADIT
jgi:hypothetical protein